MDGKKYINKLYEYGYINKTAYKLSIKELEKNNRFNEYITNKFKNIL